MKKFLRLLLVVMMFSAGLSMVAGCGNSAGNDIGHLRQMFVNEFADAENNMAQAVPLYRQGVVHLEAGQLDLAETEIVKAEYSTKQAYDNQMVPVADEMKKRNGSESEMKLASLMKERIEHFMEAVNHSLNAIDQHSDSEQFKQEMRLAQQEYWQSYSTYYQQVRNLVILDKNLAYVRIRLGW